MGGFIQRPRFVIAAIFWAGFFVLEGFDFGWACCTRSSGHRLGAAVLVNTIGPSGTATRSGSSWRELSSSPPSPGWYATLFSSLYLAVVILLAALIGAGRLLRVPAQVRRPPLAQLLALGPDGGQRPSSFLSEWRLGDLLHGLPIDGAHNYTGNFFDLLTPFGLWSGVTLLVLSLLMGATYLTLKTTGELHERAQKASTAIGVVAIVVTFGFMTWIHVGLSTGFVPKPIEALA